MADYIDLTWIDSLNQLRSFKHTLEAQGHELTLPIKLSGELKDILLKQFENNCSDTLIKEMKPQEIKTVLGLEIYEEEDNWNLVNEIKIDGVDFKENGQYNHRNIYMHNIDTLKEKILEDLDELIIISGNRDKGVIENIKEILDKRFGF